MITRLLSFLAAGSLRLLRWWLMRDAGLLGAERAPTREADAVARAHRRLWCARQLKRSFAGDVYGPCECDADILEPCASCLARTIALPGKGEGPRA